MTIIIENGEQREVVKSEYEFRNQIAVNNESGLKVSNLHDEASLVFAFSLLLRDAYSTLVLREILYYDSKPFA